MAVTTIAVPTNSYVTLVQTNQWLEDSIHAGDLWLDLDTDFRNRCILTAFRIIERQDYRGVAVGTEKWGRSGLTDEEDVAIPSGSVPVFVERAQYELSFALSQNINFQNDANTGDNIKTLKAGSAEITKFRPKGGPRFPTIINEYLGRYISGGLVLTLPVAGGTGTLTSVESFTLNRGY